MSQQSSSSLYNELKDVNSKDVYNQLPEYTRIARYAQYNHKMKRRETWEEQVDRVFKMHKVKFAHLLDNKDFMDAFNFAKKMMIGKRILGSQRALQFGGPAILNKNTRIFNCASTYTDRVRVFQEIMFTLLCGVGMGFSVQKHHIAKLPGIRKPTGEKKIYEIPDSIEGWADSIGVLMSSYFSRDQTFPEFNNTEVIFDPKLIRPKGASISHMGGSAPGPDGLMNALGKIRDLLNKCCDSGKTSLRPIDAYDIILHSSDAVLSGGIRRCIAKGLLVTTSVGSYKPIELIVKGDYVSTNNGWKKVTNTFTQGLQKTIKISHSNGDFICTPNHRLAVLKDKSFEWKEAGKLKNGDYLIFAEPDIVENGVNKLPCYTNSDIIIPDLDEEMAWLLGNIQGDKRVTLTSSLISIPIREDNYLLIQKQLLRFGVSIDIAMTENRIKIDNKQLCEYFSSFLNQIGTVHHVPQCVLNGTRNIKFAYIQGIFDIIGFVLVSIYPEEAKEIQNLLYSLGIVSNFLQFLPSSYHLNIQLSYYREKFSKGCSIGLYKFYTGDYENKYAPIRVVKTEEYILTETFDIEVEDNHNFLCEGILVHNSATISLFSLDDEEMIKAKTGDWYITNPQRARANNSAILIRNSTDKEKFMSLMDSVKQFGEPGFIFADSTETLFNPCVEVGMYGYDDKGNSGIQQCNLSEINMAIVENENDFYESCQAASILGTFQAAYTDMGYLGKVTQYIVEREALLGVSMTGMMDTPDIAFDPRILAKGANIVKEVNKRIAKLIGINQSARTTAVKPAGSTSCILGTSSGIHPCHSERYFRRVQSNKTEKPLEFFRQHNERAVSHSVWSSNNTDDVVTFLCKSKKGALTKKDVSSIDLLKKVKLVQEHWVTNGRNIDLCVQPWLNHNVSNTVTVGKNDWMAVAEYIYENRQYFAGISLLGETGDMDYDQAPFQTVYDQDEIVKMFGAGAIFASGLIVHALEAFNNNLYAACSSLLGYGEKVEMPVFDVDDTKTSFVDADKTYKKIRWIYQAKKFAKRHFGDDLLKMTYCLKHVNSWKEWADLKRQYKHVPWEEFKEEKDNTKPTEIVACSGNSCEVISF